MISIRLAAVTVAMLAACGAAQAQAPPGYELSAPYEDVFGAVTEANCERKETKSFIRFFCEQGQAFWYFTQAGRLEHPGYRTLPAYGRWDRGDTEAANRGLRQINGFGRFDSAERRDAYMAWEREIVMDQSKSTRDAATPQFKREPRGKLYPLPLAP